MDNNNTPNPVSDLDTLELTMEIVTAYLGKNTIKASEVPDLIQAVHDKMHALAMKDKAIPVVKQPAVPIEKSVTRDYLVCLEDGKKMKLLKRHLRTHYNLTPEEYRSKWNLPADYPMVAPGYAKRRSQVAKQIGLGRK